MRKNSFSIKVQFNTLREKFSNLNKKYGMIAGGQYTLLLLYVSACQLVKIFIIHVIYFRVR